MSKQLILSRRQLLKNLGAMAVASTLINPRELITAITAQQSGSSMSGGSPFSTFSIVAYDRELQAWGIAVTSKAPAVGAVVPNVGIAEDQEGQVIGGALANQSLPDLNIAPVVGMRVLLEGGTAQEALDTILEQTTRPTVRQFGMVDSQGNSAAFTGRENLRWAGHIEGDGFTVQGNTLAGPEVIEAVVDYYTASEEAFWFRLLNAIKAGEAAGGDRRVVGRDAVANSAAIKIVGYNYSVIGRTANIMDLRVDDDPDPIGELERVMELWLSFFEPVVIPPR